MYFQKRVGRPEGKAKNEGAHPPRPAWPGFQGAAGTRAGRRAQPGRARPQARLIFMSAREAPLLHGRPAGPRRPPPAFVPFPPPASPPSLRTRGRGPSAPAGLPPPLSPAPRQRRVGWPGVAGREGARGEPALPLHPPAGAAPCPPRRKVKQTRTGASAPSRSAPGPAGPLDGAPRTPGAQRTEREDEPALPTAAALRGRRPRPTAPRHRRDLPRPAPGSRPPREGVGRGGGRRTLPSPRRAGPGPRSGARDRQVTELLRSAAAPSCFPGADFSLLPPWIHLLPLHLLPLPSPGEALGLNIFCLE